MSKEQGGPAFPWCGDLNDCPTINLGMTLRDYFAAKALQGMLAADGQPDDEEEYMRRNDYKKFCKVFAESSYDMADAMLEARK